MDFQKKNQHQRGKHIPQHGSILQERSWLEAHEKPHQLLSEASQQNTDHPICRKLIFGFLFNMETLAFGKYLTGLDTSGKTSCKLIFVRFKATLTPMLEGFLFIIKARSFNWTSI